MSSHSLYELQRKHLSGSGVLVCYGNKEKCGSGEPEMAACLSCCQWLPGKLVPELLDHPQVIEARKQDHFFFLFLCFEYEVSLFRPGWHGYQRSACLCFQVLGLKVFTIMPPPPIFLLLEAGSYYIAEASLEFLGLNSCPE